MSASAPRLRRNSLNCFRDFLRTLEMLDWSPPGHIDPRATDLLAEVSQQPDLIRDVVGSWDAASMEERQLRCHETTTHYKWFIYYHKSIRYRIWLHQYKLQGERKTGHAEVPHNHRYSLASVILRGGFDHQLFDRTADGLIESGSMRTSYAKGDSYAVPWQQVHKLDNLADHTLILVVESPVVRHFSEAFMATRASRALSTISSDCIPAWSQRWGVSDWLMTADEDSAGQASRRQPTQSARRVRAVQRMLHNARGRWVILRSSCASLALLPRSTTLRSPPSSSVQASR